MNNITITLAVVTYNSVAYIDRCVRSIAQQSRNFDQVIFVDHGSSDATKDVLAAALSRYRLSALNLSLSTNLGGPAWPRNHAISNCTSTYIIFLDADDLCHPDRCLLLYKYLVNRQYDMVFHSFYNFYDLVDSSSICQVNSRGKCYRNSLPSISTRQLLSDIYHNGMSSCTGSFIVRTSLARHHLFREESSIIGAEDLYFIFDILNTF